MTTRKLLAGEARMTFGKHKDKILDEIASTEDGLKYLDWLVGQDWFEDKFKGGYLYNCIHTYLKQPDVQRELDEILGD